MDWEFIAPMIMTTVFVVTVGGVILLRPIAKRVGDLIDVYVRDRQDWLPGEVHRILEIQEMMNARLQLLEDRQDFTERLLGQGGRAGSAEQDPR